MSARKVDVLEIVSRYVSGYFPLYDLKGKFYWERFTARALVPVNQAAVKKAGKLARRGKHKFEIRYSTAVDEVIACLQRPDVKQRSWVKEEVVAIYHALCEAGLLRTVEAWTKEPRPRLVGGLLGLIMPGTFIAETMFGLVPEASKVCLCQLVEDCAAAGFEMIDVQTPHDIDEYGMPRNAEGDTPHPCMRLGEECVRIELYMSAFAAVWQRSFGGSAQDWIRVARARSPRDLTLADGLAKQANPFLSLARG
jgi:leucyl/phenylalanyl-tRNA--protein transferase